LSEFIGPVLKPTSIRFATKEVEIAAGARKNPEASIALAVITGAAVAVKMASVLLPSSENARLSGAKV